MYTWYSEKEIWTKWNYCIQKVVKIWSFKACENGELITNKRQIFAEDFFTNFVAFSQCLNYIKLFSPFFVIFFWYGLH